LTSDSKISFIALGGAEEIGASCFYLNIDGTGILLDCGIHPQKKGIDALPKFELLENLDLDYVIISHAHQDHIGALPYLVKKFPYVKIICTPQTIEVARLTLHNSVRILTQNESNDDLPKYTHYEVDLLLQSVIDVKYSDTFQLSGFRHNSANPILLKLYDAGHIIGSASILLEYESERIFYTGDIKVSKQFLMNGAKLPEQRVTTLITETTYGNTSNSNLDKLSNEVKRFIASVNKIISNGGSVLIPVFALGKMQELLWMVHSSMAKGKLTEVPIYIGGLGQKIARVYDNNRFKVNYTSTKNELLKIPTQNYFDITDFHKLAKNPCIILASSGMMLEKTVSNNFAKFWLTQESFGICVVGYIDPDTPGYSISKSNKGDTISFNSSEVVIKCEVDRFFFPTHSKREEILKIIERLNPQKIILIHGEEEAKDWIGNNCLKVFDDKRVYSARTLKQINI
jgi:Cft2 family RNA processing exonuclease